MKVDERTKHSIRQKERVAGTTKEEMRKEIQQLTGRGQAKNNKKKESAAKYAHKKETREGYKHRTKQEKRERH